MARVPRTFGGWAGHELHEFDEGFAEAGGGGPATNCTSLTKVLIRGAGGCGSERGGERRGAAWRTPALRPSSTCPCPEVYKSWGQSPQWRVLFQASISHLIMNQVIVGDVSLVRRVERKGQLPKPGGSLRIDNLDNPLGTVKARITQLPAIPI